MRSKRFFGIALLSALLLFCTLLSVGVSAEGHYALLCVAIPEDTGSFQIEIDGVVSEGNEFSVESGSTVTVKAQPIEGYVFGGWSFQSTPEGIGEEDLKKSEIVFVMPEEKVVIEAEFLEEEGKYTVTVEANDYGMGSFGHQQFTPGVRVSVEALPYEGYQFKRWLDPADTLENVDLPENWEEDPTISFEMPERSVALEIEFEPITYYMTVIVEGQGEVFVAGKEKITSGKYKVHVGETLAITAVGGKDTSFVGWSVSNSAALADYDRAETTVTCPAADFSLTVTFASSVRMLTVQSGEGGRVQPDPGNMSVGVGNVVSLMATPND